jgi:hypothetical protein
MNASVDIAPTLGAAIHHVAEGHLSLSALLDTVERWALDMAQRQHTAVQANTGQGQAMITAIRARGMYLAVLSLQVRLELLLEGRIIADQT